MSFSNLSNVISQVSENNANNVFNGPRWSSWRDIEALLDAADMLDEEFTEEEMGVLQNAIDTDGESLESSTLGFRFL